MRVPTFLGIGAPKCATTWLAKVLQAHPDIYIPPIKEVVYFSSEKRFRQGERWYLSHFETKAPVVGEYTVSYLGAGRRAAERIHKLNPNMKLIAVLRDPVQRAYSHYRWYRQLGRDVPSTFLDALQPGSKLVHDGLYAANIAPFLELFPADQILILQYENLTTSTDAVFRFLGVDPITPDTRRIGRTISPRYQWLERLRVRAHMSLRRYPRLMGAIKRLGVSHLYRTLNDGKAESRLSEHEYRSASRIFIDDALRLQHLTEQTYDWQLLKPPVTADANSR